jgi:16S rRNA (guanine527-N7)-methyltransferase
VEHAQECRDLLVHSCREIGLTLTKDQVAQFMRYLSELLHWNRTINLTSITDPQQIVIKHFVDSATALVTATFPLKGVLVDIGTGGGIPGIPLKIIRNDLKVTLVEPIQKKCSFLASAVGVLKLEDIDIFSGTLRQYCGSERSPADIVTVRALRFEEIKDQLGNLVSSIGRIFLYRTETLSQKDLQSAGKPGWDLMIETQRHFSLPRNNGKRVISVLAKTSHN